MNKPKTQAEAIRWHLEHIGPITSWEAIQQYGVTRLSSIIFNLKKEGLHIQAGSQTQQNRFGNPVTFATYAIVPKKNKFGQSELF